MLHDRSSLYNIKLLDAVCVDLYVSGSVGGLTDEELAFGINRLRSVLQVFKDEFESRIIDNYDEDFE